MPEVDSTASLSFEDSWLINAPEGGALEKEPEFDSAFHGYVNFDEFLS